ncbi:glycosyltransferase [Algoriphagus marinus]|uniref:glycosyltransferase n=1 Tax=Algoriphagus marinus TaxID=1925762 RepID=UPI00094B9E3A|nr:glycosyltransferase [Algoriphagus marinus]
MKILQLIQKQQLRGAEIFAAQLSEELLGQGNEVILVSLFEGVSKLPFSGRCICLEANSDKRFWDFKTWKKLAALIAEFQPDIVQANAGDTLKYAAFSRLLFGWKAKLIFRNANMISGFVTSIPKKIYNDFLLRQVAGIASVSAICARDFIQTFSFPESKVEVLPIGVLPVKETLNLPEDLIKILGASDFLIHIGSFVPEKNHQELFLIFDQILLKFPDLKLLLLGEGPLKPHFQNQFTDRSEILFAGVRTDVDAILPFAKALLLPSLIEGLPGVILEAMNSLVPMISYNVGGISEVVSPETGWLVPKADRGQFVKAVVEVLSFDNKSKLKIQQNAKQLVEDHYQVSVLAKRFEIFYKERIRIN